MTFQNIVGAIAVGGFVAVLLFQTLYMAISPERWVRSKWALKSGNITEATICRKGGRMQARITGSLAAIVVFWFVYLFIRALSR